MFLKTVSRIKDLHTQGRQYTHLAGETVTLMVTGIQVWQRTVETQWEQNGYECGAGSHTENRRYQKTLDTGPEPGVGTAARMHLSLPAEVTSSGSSKALMSRSQGGQNGGHCGYTSDCWNHLGSGGVIFLVKVAEELILWIFFWLCVSVDWNNLENTSYSH